MDPIPDMQTKPPISPITIAVVPSRPATIAVGASPSPSLQLTVTFGA